MAMIELEGNPPIAVHLRRSARARRLSLRLSGLDGRVTLTLPRFTSERQGMAFLRDKEGWLRDQLAEVAAPVTVGPGSILTLRGEDTVIAPGAGRGVKELPGRLEVGGAAAQVPARLRAWLKAQARADLDRAVARYTDRLSRPAGRITLRDTRSRWGSCAASGALSFSWRLVLAPPAVLDYVAAHEVAHLAEMNHSRRFWDTVTRIHGPWQAERAWLRTHGARLHRFRFGD